MDICLLVWILQTLRIARLFHFTKESNKVLFAVPQIGIA